MKRSLISRSAKQALLAVPAAALMLGAAQAGTTVGLNFQQWYYDSGNNPQTIGFNSGYSDYNTTGFPVTTDAFGVKVANWVNTDPLGSSYNSSPISQACTFGGTATTFAGGLSCSVNSPKGTQSSGSGELQALNTANTGYLNITYAPGVWTPPGNDEVLWGNIIGDDANRFSVSVTGLAAKFPNGYAIQSLAASGNEQPLLPSVDFTDGVTTNTSAYHIWLIQNNPAAQWPSSRAGISDPSGKFTADTIYLNSRSDGTGFKSSLAGFIITDQAVVSRPPVGGTYAVGQTINLSVDAVGIPPLAYQWRSNGIPIPSATSAVYSVPSAAAGTNNYDVIVTNLYGSATSDVAAVSVFLPLTMAWDADPVTTGAQDGSGNWDNGLTANWWNGSADVVWGVGNNAVFGAGGSGVYGVTVTNSVIVNRLVFNSGNYTIIAGGTNQTLALVGEAQITANTNATLSLPLAGTSGMTKDGNGALTLDSSESYTGGTVVNAGVVNLSVGGQNGTLQDGLIINSNATVVCTVNNALGYNEGANWVRSITLNFGTLTTSIANSDEGWGTMINMVGGTLGSTVANGHFAMGGGPVFNVTGTNVPSVISANLNVRDGTAGIVFNVTRGTASADLLVTGPIVQQSSGGISLNGGGIMQLSAVNTYTGPTIVKNGTLNVTGELTGNGAISLNDTATLNTTAGSLAAAITTTSLTLGASGASFNTLGFASLNSTTLAPISGGSLYVSNAVTVNITGSIPATGQYPLIQYGGETGPGAFALGTLPSGVSATLVDDHTSSVYLNVTATPVQTEVWHGSPNGNWDINNTANWLIGASASKWFESNVAIFDDTAAGTTAITLNTNVHPVVLTFSNIVKNYSISGSGSIAGATVLTLDGTGTVTLGNATNTYTGGTILNAGTLAVGADSSLGAGSLTFDGGTLDVTGTTAFTSTKNITLNASGGTIQVDNTAGAGFAPGMTGGGALTKNGNGTLTLSSQQTYTGGTTVNGGILDLTGGGGSSGVIRGTATINTGATLRLSTGDAIGYTAGLNNLSSINLVGGTLNVNTTANQTLGSATINLTGGAITGLAGGNIDFFGGASALNTSPSSIPSTISGTALGVLRQGSTTFDVPAGTTPNGIDLDISSVLQYKSETAGSVLYKADTGTMRLSAVNTYQGSTEVQGGTLILTGQLIGGGAMTVDDGATLIVSAGSNPAIINASDLNLGTGGTLTLGFVNVNSPTVPIVSVTNLAINDTVTVNIGGRVAVGQLPLIKYGANGGTRSGAGSFTLGSLPAGVSATLFDNTANNSVDLDVTAAPASIIIDLSGTTNYLYPGATYTLSVTAGGNNLTYQWKKNGSTPVGGNSSTLTIPGVTAANQGSYSVTVSNTGGSVQSATNHLVVLPASGYTSQLVAYWPLNEASGTTAFDLAGGNNATYSGALTLGVPGIATGDSDTAVNFTGGTATAPYSSSLNPSVFTVEFWSTPGNLAASYVASLQDRTTGRMGYAIMHNNGGNGVSWSVSFGQSPTTYSIIGGTTTVVVGTKYHVAATYDGTTIKLYVNGALETSSVTTYQPATSAQPGFTMGSRNGNNPANGVLEDVRIYSRALDASEISAVAVGGPPATVNVAPANITNSISGSTLTLTWPSGQGWRLVSQTNNLSTGLGANWGTVPGVSDGSAIITIDPTKPTVFYRLSNP